MNKRLFKVWFNIERASIGQIIVYISSGDKIRKRSY